MPINTTSPGVHQPSRWHPNPIPVSSSNGFSAPAPRGERKANLALRQEQQRSILDFVLEDARDLSRRLANRDRAEARRVPHEHARDREAHRELSSGSVSPRPTPRRETPAGIPDDFEVHIEVMFDMLALAFETDSTRVATFLLANEGSNRAFPEPGNLRGPSLLDAPPQRSRRRWTKCPSSSTGSMSSISPAFLGKLDRTEDVDGNSVLHNSMIVYGCGNADGNRHTHSNLPVILAGFRRRHALGSLGATSITARDPSPIFTSAWATCLGHEQGVERFGDSTGTPGPDVLSGPDQHAPITSRCDFEKDSSQSPRMQFGQASRHSHYLHDPL